MTELSTTVEIDGKTREVVYNPEEDEWDVRQTTDQLRSKMITDAHDAFSSYTCGYCDVNWARYYEAADREGNPVAEMYVTPRHFVEFAQEVADYADEIGIGYIQLFASKDMPLIAQFDDGTQIAMAPRIKRE